MKAEVPTLCQLCSAQIALHGDGPQRKTGAEAPRLGGCCCSFLSLQRAFAHLSVNSLSMLLAAAFLCWLWAEEVPKITRRALPLVGHSLWWLQGSLACSLQAQVPRAPAQTSCGHPSPPPQPPQPFSGASTFPFIALLRVSPGGWGPLFRPRSSARYYQGTLVLPCPCRPCWHS